jgi:predicted kinase
VVTIEVGGARVIVDAGFDRGTLREVLAVLAEARWTK